MVKDDPPPFRLWENPFQRQEDNTMNRSLPSSANGSRTFGIRIFAWIVVSAAAWLAAYSLIQPLTDWLTFSALGLPRNSPLGQSIAFFLYDVPKIILLLGGMIFLISFLRTFFRDRKSVV